KLPQAVNWLHPAPVVKYKIPAPALAARSRYFDKQSPHLQTVLKSRDVIEQIFQSLQRLLHPLLALNESSSFILYRINFRIIETSSKKSSKKKSNFNRSLIFSPIQVRVWLSRLLTGHVYHEHLDESQV